MIRQNKQSVMAPAILAPARAPGVAALAAAFVIGAIARAIALPTPGAGDVANFKTWMYAVTTAGVTRVYGVGGSPLDQPKYTLIPGLELDIEYPPMSLYELAVAGHMHQAANGGRFPDTPRLTLLVKGLPVLFEALLVAVLFAALRRTSGPRAAGWAAAAYWLNPAALLVASLGGYLDPLMVLPAAASLVAVAAGWPVAAGALVTCAALTKLQGLFVVPAVVVAAWNSTSPPRAAGQLARVGAGAALAAAAILGPFVIAGAWPNMFAMVRRQITHDALANEGLNFWWIVGNVMLAGYHWLRGATLSSALTSPASELTFESAAAHGFPYLRVVAAVMTVSAIAWAVWTARRARDLPLVAALAAFGVQAFATVGPAVHENHLFAAVPLLVVAAAGRSAFRPVLAAVSFACALNLLFWGVAIGDRWLALPRTLTIIDTTLVAAAFSCGVLVWHAVVLRRSASDERP
jgi:hypothetical protein